jgi:NAD(P)-dependent dehydrogenase (short-subunit alcohol dehydrogenase family)
MKNKTVLITGANSGIGLETAVELTRAGADVAIVCRTPEKSERAAATILERAGRAPRTFAADLSSQQAIRALAAEVDAALPRIDVLVNNAGLIVGERRVTIDGLETTFAVNHLGYFLLTRLLEEKLRASAPARIVSVASEAHRSAALDFDDLQSERGYSGWTAYCRSKLANVMFTYELARRLEGSGVTANCLHPGVIGSNFANDGPLVVRLLFKLAKPFLTSPAGGAQTSIHLASSPDVEGVTGKYFASKRETLSSPASYDEAAQTRLWSESERLTAGAS